jgi:hypothetical protein
MRITHVAAIARLFRLPPAIGADLAVELANGSRDQRDVQGIGGIRNRQPRRKIVRPVDDEITVAEQFLGIVAGDPDGDTLKGDIRIEAIDLRLRYVEFWLAHIIGAKQDLPLEI